MTSEIIYPHAIFSFSFLGGFCVHGLQCAVSECTLGISVYIAEAFELFVIHFLPSAEEGARNNPLVFLNNIITLFILKILKTVSGSLLKSVLCLVTQGHLNTSDNVCHVCGQNKNSCLGREKY